jgi:hypothetical protein
MRALVSVLTHSYNDYIIIKEEKRRGEERRGEKGEKPIV